MSRAPTELKAALPADFSGEPADAIWWIQAMHAYFAINKDLYTLDSQRIMTILNNMSQGQGVSFSEMWYNKMSDTAADLTDLTFDKFIENFESTFFPFNTKATIYHKFSKLTQKSFHRPDGVTKDGF